MARKKTTHQSQKQHHPNILLPPPDLDSEASAKLQALKSLNQRLLKEEYARRQQVESVLRANESLEAELNRAKLRNLDVEAAFEELIEIAAKLEAEKNVFDVFLIAHSDLRTEVMEQWMGTESRAAELKSLNEEKESEIRRVSDRLTEIALLLMDEKKSSERLSIENGDMKEDLVSKTNEIRTLNSHLFEVQERNKNITTDMRKLQSSHDGLATSTKEKEAQIESLSKDKDTLIKSLGDSKKLIEELKVKICNSAKETQRVEEMKLEEMNRRKVLEIVVSELKATVAGLEKDKEAALSEHSTLIEKMEKEIDRLTQEKKIWEEGAQQSSAEKCAMEIRLSETVQLLAEEKHKAEKLVHENDTLVEEITELKAINSETIKTLESKLSHFAFILEHAEVEKKRLENNLDGAKQKMRELDNETAEAKAVRDAEKEMVELEVGTLRRQISCLESRVVASQNAKGRVLKILKETAESHNKVMINDDDEEEVKAFVKEIETMKKSSRDEMEKMKTKNKVWTLLTSATALLAACSFAYAAREH
ncbi:hypothetical protein M569_07986 [Genlisea aurea]|uniref:Uncharacterized protein n=1 Tax=Genlisea aurea TaxID=192259 RepID=S8DUA4_9LAMI|nr:hypothetical protein M569_07986 [Genlisea aurea]